MPRSSGSTELSNDKLTVTVYLPSAAHSLPAFEGWQVAWERKWLEGKLIFSWNSFIQAALCPLGYLQLARELEELLKCWQKYVLVPYPPRPPDPPSTLPPDWTFGLEQSKKCFSLGVILRPSFATDKHESMSKYFALCKLEHSARYCLNILLVSCMLHK